MTSRLAGVGVLLAAFFAGLAFSPVFATTALLLPVLAVVVPVAAIDLLALKHARLAAVRPILGLILGAAVGLVVLCLPHLPWGTAALPVLDGALHGWLHTLESTFPARPDAALLAFVPLLALLAGVIGLEWLRRGFAPLVTLLPSLAVVGLSQVFRAASGWQAVGLAAGYAAAGALVLAAGRRGTAARWTGRRLIDALVLVVPVALVAVLGAWGLASADPLHLPAYSVHDKFEVAAVPSGAVSPLSEIGGRLDKPGAVVFTARTDAPVDRWPQIVLDGFDGAGWTSSATYRPLGAELDADPAVTVAKRTFQAEITLGSAAAGPWLPTQLRTLSVDGLRPAVDPFTGTLLETTTTDATSYTLHWQAPQPARDQLVGAAVVRGAAGSLVVGDVPAGVVKATETALAGAPPSFAAALKLEAWLKDNYKIATGDELPTGSGSAQLLDFLDRTHRGTSEQFATAYVLMASTVGIPARLVVGFRQPKPDSPGLYVVHNADAFAWPEVDVAGVGWVPLDPTGGARENPQNSPPTTQATDAARQQAQQGVGTSTQPGPAAAPRAQPQAGPSNAPWTALQIIGLAIVAALLAWILGVPATKLLRRLKRRRAAGAAGVVGAWLDTRDRLRDHGVAAGPAMTVRDAAEPASAVLNGTTAELDAIARCIDVAVWSGNSEVPPALTGEAWRAAASIRRELGKRPVPERVRAAVGIRGLRAPHD
ncbi:transglutaminaseTgpA domain-containing protein [Pseudonocardia sp. GCM10023141]|uniref:transglutaminaseTgpA domain-containing protein n=1 Tax=Pseudonocardia sp. GCM10023141 TaxID=3252653 RepID=UPI00360ABECE